MILGYTEFFLSMLKGILIVTTRAPQAKKISIFGGILKIFINVEGYTDCDYKGAAGEKFSIFGGILKFFSMRVGGAPSVTCNADFQFPISLGTFSQKGLSFNYYCK